MRPTTKDWRFFRYGEGMTDLDVAPTPLDFLALGRRLRHYRQAKGLTLDELGAAVGRASESLVAHRERTA